jgi:hypothetical protein
MRWAVIIEAKVASVGDAAEVQTTITEIVLKVLVHCVAERRCPGATAGQQAREETLR